MRVLIQRVTRAKVEVEGKTVGAIGPGLLLLIGLGAEDDESLAAPLASKIVRMRLFPGPDDRGNCERSILDTGGEILAVSQFTLYAHCRKGCRPSFSDAARPDRAQALFENFVRNLRAHAVPVATGRFGAMMQVHLVNDGPVTIWLDSREALAAQ